jgi:hypothetical protein
MHLWGCPRLPLDVPRLDGGAHQFPREVAEMALAHAISNKVEDAYRRGDLFDKRKKLMDAWARHCELRAIIGEVLEFKASVTVVPSRVSRTRVAGTT